jgi:hypothetical protein
MSMEETRAMIETGIEEFHQRHVTPHGTDGTLDVRLLCGIRIGSERKVCSTQKSMVTDESPCCAVGIGAIEALSLFDRFFAPMNTLGAMLLAAFIIFRVKDVIQHCGKETDITCLRGESEVLQVTRAAVRSLEDVFREYSQLEAGLLHKAFSDRIGWSGVKPKNMSSEVRKVRRRIDKIVQSISASNSSISQT